MITKQQAESIQHGTELHYTGRHDCARIVGPRGGVTENVTRVRVTGRCRTWKTRPEEFVLPVKYGLREHGEVNQNNQAEWHRACDCPLHQTDQAK